MDCRFFPAQQELEEFVKDIAVIAYVFHFGYEEILRMAEWERKLFANQAEAILEEQSKAFEVPHGAHRIHIPNRL